MSEQILTILKCKLDNLAAYGSLDAETRRNALKEELQFYVLNFIYHHPKYNTWIMYGGSSLRIIHGLDRMSIDIDFEISHAITKKFLEELKKEVENHFTNMYGAGDDFLTVKITAGRGLLLKFYVGEELSSGHPSKQVHVKIDLNHFIAQKTVTESRLINHNQFSFVILTYNKGALMASKIAAIFLREERGRGKNIYDYKGRDIYDLLWYMKEKTTPDFDYLNAKLKEGGKDMPDMRALFDKLTVNILNYEKMDACLKDDLSFLFENPFQFDNWLKTWRKNYLRFLDEYKIRAIKELESIGMHQDFRAGELTFIFWYNTIENESVKVEYNLSDYWIKFREGEITIAVEKIVEEKIEFSGISRNSGLKYKEKLKQYATLFYQKTEKYFKKTNGVMLGDAIITKVIRMTADNLNQKEQIMLNKSALLSRELDDLLK
jgi:hypothetical protein